MRLWDNCLWNMSAQRTHEEPLGKACFLLGLEAYDALYDLCDVPSWNNETRGRWRASDQRSFYGWLGIEENTLAALASTDEAAQERIDDILHSYHVALPYDEAERWWLCEAMSKTVDRSDRFAAIRHIDDRLVTGGLRKVVYGRELLGRWWSWRRGTDQFAGQGTVGLAREALRTLVETTAPDLGLPETYSRSLDP